MRQALAGVPDKPFPVPPGIRSVPVDPRTGKRPNLDAGCEDYIVEAFIEGTEPGELCSPAVHDKLLLPHSFQRYRLDVDGSLMIPRNELQQLLVLEQDVAFDADSRTLVAWGREGVTEFRVSELPDTVPPEERLPDELQEQRYGWAGTDGRLARVVWFGDSTQGAPDPG